MTALLLAFCAMAALAYVGLVSALLVGWGPSFSQVQRFGLAMSASGVVLAGVPRLMGQPPGVGDLMFLVGLITFFGATYGAAIFHNLDGLDGVFDGRVTLRRPRR